jgi:hypothetical protein
VWQTSPELAKKVLKSSLGRTSSACRFAFSNFRRNPYPNTNADGDFGLVSMAGQQGGADSGYANGNGSNSFIVDGASATSNYSGEARGRTRVPYVFGEQSIQEFEVTDNPYNAALPRRGCRLRPHGDKIGNGLLPWSVKSPVSK